MNSVLNKINTLIVGATGKLGLVVTKHCLNQPNLQVNILVRDPQKNKALTAQIEAAGGKVLKGDMTQPETIKGTTKGMHTVILTSETSAEAQITVIKDCIENGVERVVPSSYITNVSKFSPEEKKRSLMATKFDVIDYLKTAPIKSLIFDTGLLTEWVFLDVLSKEFVYWGDESLKLQLTSYDDTARVVADGVARNLSGHFVYISDEASVADICEAYNKIRGTSFKPRRLGSLQDVTALKLKAEKEGDPNAYLHELHEITFDERSRFEKNDNAQFPDVKPTSIEEYLKQRTDIKVGA